MAWHLATEQPSVAIGVLKEETGGVELSIVVEFVAHGGSAELSGTDGFDFNKVLDISSFGLHISL